MGSVYGAHLGRCGARDGKEVLIWPWVQGHSGFWRIGPVRFKGKAGVLLILLLSL